MSNVIYLDTSKVPHGHRNAAPLRAQSGPRVYVRETRTGIWAVHADDDHKGGCFRSRDAAFRFVTEEFGTMAETVVQPRFPTAGATPVIHLNATSSVAHKATATH